MIIITKATSDKNGMVTKPNQSMYCDVQDTVLQAGAVSAKKLSF